VPESWLYLFRGGSALLLGLFPNLPSAHHCASLLRTEVAAFPKSSVPPFDLASLRFFLGYAGVAQACMFLLKFSIIVRGPDMGCCRSLIGAPARLCAVALQRPAQGRFRLSC